MYLNILYIQPPPCALTEQFFMWLYIQVQSSHDRLIGLG